MAFSYVVTIVLYLGLLLLLRPATHTTLQQPARNAKYRSNRRSEYQYDHRLPNSEIYS